MLQTINTSNGSKIKQAIKGKNLPALTALAGYECLPDNATYQDKKELEKPLLAAINEYREKRGYANDAGIEGQMYFLLQGDIGRGDYSEEMRKTRETLIEIMALLGDPEVSNKLEGYTKHYAGGMLKRLHNFFKTLEGDYFLSYMDKQRFDGAQDYEVAALNRTLSIYRAYDGEGAIYVYDQDGMCPKDEYAD